MICTRRVFLRNTAALSAAGSLALMNTGCKTSSSGTTATSGATSEPATSGGPSSLPIQGESVQPASAVKLENLPPPDRTVLTLNRISFGISQTALDRAYSIGIDAFIEEQLDYQSIDDPIEAEVALRYPMTQYTGAQLVLAADTTTARNHLRDATLMRAYYSPRQLYVVMVEFWSNHFSVDNRFGNIGRNNIIDNRDMIRPHALGKFRDLLYASAKGPAMLKFLDNQSNTDDGPNENYARELMELHTLGIDGGYTEQDVKEVARCFTGWRFDSNSLEFIFEYWAHDNGEKTVLGQTIPAGLRQAAGEQVMEILLAHPSTAHFLATKLVRRFVSDTPPESLVTRVAEVYAETDGDIPSMLRTILTSAEFLASADEKLKRPLDYIAAAIRALAPQLDHYNGADPVASLQVLGQVPFEWPTPDGYPDTAEHWLSAMGLAERWEFALQLAENKPNGISHADELVGDALTANTLVDRLADRIIHRPLSAEDRQALVAAVVENSYGPDDVLPTDWLSTKAGFVASSLLGSPYFLTR